MLNFSRENTGLVAKWWRNVDKQILFFFIFLFFLGLFFSFSSTSSIVAEKMNKQTGLKLSPTYSYTRLYEKGVDLEKHIDRYSCEVSATLNLGGDVWPIWLTDTKGKDIEVKLNPSDMLIYSGCELPHWRNKFEGNQCVQVFLHYNDTSNPKWENNKYDNRQHLGLPVWFKGKKLL